MNRKISINHGWMMLVAVLAAALPCSTPAAQGEERKAPAYPDHANLMVARDGRGRETPVQNRADWDVRRAHILAHLQEVMGPLPGGERRVPLDVQIVSTEQESGYVRKKLTFAVEPGDRVPAWLLIPDADRRASKRAPAMLCLHQTIKIGKDEPVGLGSNKNLQYAKELAERGYVTLSPDYPNYGEYKADVYAMGYASASMKAIWNNMRGVDLLQSLDEVDPDRIGVVGHSLGGHNSIFTALFDPRLKAVVSSAGFNAFPDYMNGNVAGWSHSGYMPRLKEVYQLDLKRIPFDFPELIGALAPRDFFTNSPLHDDNFAVAGVRTCIQAAAPVFKLLGGELVAVHPDAEHSFPESARKQAYTFLDARLKAK